MKRVLLACAAFAAAANGPGALAAPDVAEFSASDAQALLNEAPQPACDQPAADGTCPAVVPNRGWRFGGARTGTVAQPVSPARQAMVPPRRSRIDTAPVTGTRKIIAPRLLPLQFGLGSAELSVQSRANLKNLADALNEPGNSAKHIRITGHTDKTGSLELNQQLSLHRAEAASAFLASLGVAPDRVEAVGRAFEAPLDGMADTDPRNRRVEVQRIK